MALVASGFSEDILNMHFSLGLKALSVKPANNVAIYLDGA